jgi:glycosyltransferase involved in cell wall biosynthesis
MCSKISFIGLFFRENMTVYFYHTIPVAQYYKDWHNSQCPGHLLYGLTHFSKYGINAIYHTIPFNPYKWRLRLSFFNLIPILFCRKSFDAVYAVTHHGLEALIFLRALRLYRKPIIVWHHSAIVVPSSRIRRIFSTLFYKGIDKACFFSQPLLDRSVETGKIKKENAFLIHWGSDLAFYDTVISRYDGRKRYISTGRENRDIITLIKAFNATSELCDIYLPSYFDYKSLLEQENLTANANIRVFFVNMGHFDIAKIAGNAFAIVISCLDRSYTVGLTSLVEALALGIPVITTDNSVYPIDVEKENVGMKIPYQDINAWIKAIQYLSANPDKAKEMGNNARLLAEREYNLEFFSKEVASILLSLKDSYSPADK